MPRIRLFGQRSKLGFGIFYSEFVDSLQRIAIFGRIVEAIDLTADNQITAAVESSSGDDINIWFWLNPYIGSTKGIHIIWSLFESDRLDQTYLYNHLSSGHIIWTPSSWGKKVLLNHGVPDSRVDIVPGGVNPALFHPLLRSTGEQRKAPFRFLTIGKYEKRKGYEPLLLSFLHKFNNDTSVMLDIKADFFLEHAERRSALEQLIKKMGLKNVNLIWGKLDDQGMFSLYNRASAFVYPSRAEGWGLPLIEAIAMGIPTISTFYSGHTEFLSCVDDLFLKIRHTLCPIDDEHFFKYWPRLKELDAQWAEPSTTDIASHMADVIDEYSLWQSNALKASDVVRKDFSWRNSAEAAIRCIMRRGLISVHHGP